MEQRPNDAAVKVVQIKPSREECVLDMAQRKNTNDVVSKDAQVSP